MSEADMKAVEAAEVTPTEEHEVHEHPRGALLLTIFYLLLLVFLWLQVYLQLLSQGGIQPQ